MKKPKQIPLTDSPKHKKVKQIPLPSIENQYDISMTNDIYIRPDNDSIYTPVKDEDHRKNNS
jgi:hypothetical protein